MITVGDSDKSIIITYSVAGFLPVPSDSSPPTQQGLAKVNGDDDDDDDDDDGGHTASPSGRV